MSAYSTTNDDIRPGLRNRPRGAVHLYHTSSMSRGSTRALNHLERDEAGRKLEEGMQAEIEMVRERYAERFLEFLRAQLDGINLRGHVIVLSAGMGRVSLIAVRKRDMRVRFIHDYRSRGYAIDVLQEMDQYLEGAWDWGSYLNKKTVTRH